MNLSFNHSPDPHESPDRPGETSSPDPASLATGATTPSLPESTPSWRISLHREIDDWLDTLSEEPGGLEEPEDPLPDLYSFFEVLSTLSMESRKSNRRTAEAFSQWNSTLEQFQQTLDRWGRHIGGLMEARPDGLSRNQALVVVEFLDRVQRLADAFHHPPESRWWSRDRAWRESWENQCRALDILREHLRSFLLSEDIQAVEAMGQSFDPTRMSAIAAIPTDAHPHNSVIAVEIPGYRRGREILRVAQVTIAVAPAGSQD